MNSNSKTGQMNRSKLPQTEPTHSTGVVWALEVTPSVVSTNNLNTVPITQYVVNNISEDITSSLVSVLPSGNQSTVPLNAITEDLYEKSYVMIPTLDNSLTNPIQFLDSKTLENSMSIMRAIPPRDIQKKNTHKNTIPQNTSQNPDIPTSKCDIEVVVKKDNDVQNINYDKIHFTHVADSRVLPRAVSSLPTSLQRYRGQICSRKLLMARTRFGPVQGIRKQITRESVESLILDAFTKKKPLFLVHNEMGGVTHIDVTDSDKSNWLSLLPLGDMDTANVWLYEHDCELFAVTLRSVTPRTPLAIGYCDKYVRDHSVPAGLPSIDIAEALSNNNKRDCEQCGQGVAPALLPRHVDLYHKEKSPNTRRNKYRCVECAQVFSRLFCLKRHKLLHCPKKNSPKIKDESLSKSQIDDVDVKLPSDESLQNILDFSASLMDPDKLLPNLDISSSSKSDENCSYSNASDGESRLVMDYDDIHSPVEKDSQKVRSSSQNTEDLIPCRLCKQAVPANDYKTHFRSCRSRQLECCGRVFRNKLIYDEHIHAQHVPNVQQSESKENVVDAPKSINKQYPCEDCELVFKRRGMLINHYWRAHPSKARAVKVPVLKTERRYLCSVCPKLYRTAAKRDRHVNKHHPGRSLFPRSSYCVETGVKPGNAALCTFCPKQYATRAKLLQHMRNKHINEPVPSTVQQQKSSNKKTRTK